MIAQPIEPKNNVPLIVDLDGTYIRSDISLEFVVCHLMRKGLLGFFQLVGWFIKGRAFLKYQLAKLYGESLDVDNLPISDLRNAAIFQVAQNRVLVSGTPHTILEKIASSNGNFRSFKGSASDLNLVGREKAKYLSQTYPQGFDYIGNSKDDIHVWKQARRAYAFNASKAVQKSALNENVDLKVLQTKRSWLLPLIKAMRLHQWVKNLLLGLLIALNIANFTPDWLSGFAIAFFSFGLVASGTYLINDLSDLQSDRQHPVKKNRPLASGDLEIPYAIWASLTMITAGFIVGSLISEHFVYILAAYLVLTFLYSYQIKKLPVFDVVCISFLFCLRIYAGGEIIGMAPNLWLIVACGLFFLSLVLGKRATEIEVFRSVSKFLPGRGYSASDFGLVMIAGISTGFLSVLTIMVYFLLSQSVAITSGLSAFIVCILILSWVVRFWFLISNNRVTTDPVIFAITDKISLMTGLLLALTVITEQIGSW